MGRASAPGRRRPASAERHRPDARISGADARARGKKERRLRRRHRRRGARQTLGPHVPARREDARDGKAGPAPGRHPRRQAVGAGGGPAGGGCARPGRTPRRRARPALRLEPVDLLELFRAGRGGRQQHDGRPWKVRRRCRASRRPGQGDLPPGAVTPIDDALWRPPGVRARWHVVRHAGRALDHAGAHAGAADGQPARQDRPDQQRRHDPEGQPVCRPGRRASRDLVVRPPERAGGDAESRDRRTVGGRARHARRRRDQHLAQGQGLRLADDRVRDRIPGRADYGRNHGEGRHGAADLLLGSGYRTEWHDLSTPATCSRHGRAACSSEGS